MCVLQLRRCEFYEWIFAEGKWQWEETATQGLFHCWSVQYEEFENGAGNFAVGIVEDLQGHVHVIHDPSKIKFV